uniref:DUF7044 domain-containing protein n=1 Tax=Angiostrongylus cantonensis TaxID=6313 RepID=A0A0K0D6K2_ANGCA
MELRTTIKILCAFIMLLVEKRSFKKERRVGGMHLDFFRKFQSYLSENTNGALLACRIDNALHGVFKRQLQSNRNLIFDSSFKDPIIYDEITISATSISDFGECYEKAGLSYVFGLK